MKNEIVLFTDGDVNIEVQINPEHDDATHIFYSQQAALTISQREASSG